MSSSVVLTRLLTGEEKKVGLIPENCGREREVLITADAIVGILTHTITLE